MKKIILFALFLLLLIPAVYANTEIFYFHSTGGSTSDSMFNFLIRLGKQDESIIINKFNIDDDPKNREMLDILAEKYGINSLNLPVVFIDDTAFVGYNPLIKEKIIEKNELCRITECYSAATIGYDESFYVERGETSYMELYKLGSGLLQGIMLVIVIVIIAYVFVCHRKFSIEASQRKRKKIGKIRVHRKVK